MENISDKKSLFKAIDEFFDKQIDALRSTPAFQKTTEQLRSLSEAQQIVINQLLNASSFFIPLVIILVLLVVRYSYNSELEIRKEIEDNIITIKENRVKYSRLSSKIVSPVMITDKATLVTKIKDIAKSSKLKSTSMSVDNFDLSSPGGEINQVSATIKFNALTSVMFSDFILNIQNKLKSRVTQIDVKKNLKTSRLDGNFDITLYTRSAN